jgi:pimeloyl-ACP methyl ester carboxylesterase
MKTRFRSWQLHLVLAVICIVQPTILAQNVSKPDISVCDKTAITSAASGALRLVCHEPSINSSSSSWSIPLIVIGFVGGFAKADDRRHPESLFALYLQQEYGAQLRARVFSNHDAADAKLYVLKLLDTDHDGVVSTEERKKARIIVYGHSWGASETAAFAKELGKLDVPVLLTVQLDIISKPRQKPDIIPPNVAEAINFYQSGGPLHGRPKIVASNPSMTTILGNVHMTYDRFPVNCDNYNWFVRNFNKPHHEIENDPRVWKQVSSLINTEVDKMIPPPAQRAMPTRAGAEVTEAPGSHAIFVSSPEVVASVIKQAAVVAPALAR